MANATAEKTREAPKGPPPTKEELDERQGLQLAGSFIPAKLLAKAQMVAGVEELAPFKAAEFFFRQLNIPNDQPEDLAQCLAVCSEYGLNPLLKHIYGFKGQNNAYIPIVGIDGWLHIANSHPQFDGIETEFTYTDDGKLHSCIARVFRKDRSRPIVAEELLSENNMGTPPWVKRPSRMLSHRARAQAIRTAFGVSGVWHDMEPDEVVVDTTAEVTGPKDRPSNKAAARLAARVESQLTIEPKKAAPAHRNGNGNGTPEPEFINPGKTEVAEREPEADFEPLTDEEKAEIERQEAAAAANGDMGDWRGGGRPD